jgi:microsomal epoxide hydrolase
MPGYGFSEAPTTRGFDVPEVARSFHCLMQQLGYERYAAQGGDWGSVVVQTLARLQPSHVQGIHINMPTPRRADGKRFGQEDAAKCTPHEIKGLMQSMEFAELGTGYQAIQRSKPQTLSYGLNDSPVGLLAWILEKVRSCFG